MTNFLQFLLLGLGTGALAALLGLGITLIYRGSGTINFAHGSFALLGAYLYYELDAKQGWPKYLSIAVAALLVGAAGIAVHWLLMRPLRGKSALTRVIATLGILTVLQQAVTIRYGAEQVVVAAPLPEDALRIGGVTVGRYVFWLLAIALVVTGLLSVLTRRTRTGLAISAAAENQRAAAALGQSPDRLASVAWGGGGLLAGIAGILFAATSSNFLSIGGLSLVIISGLAAALLGGFKSYPLVLLGGLLVGAGQSEALNPDVQHWLSKYISTTGVADAVPFIVIVIVLILQGRGLPVRGAITEKLPKVGDGRISRTLVVGVTVIFSVCCIFVFKDAWNGALVTNFVVALVGLSIVVVTGYAGQLSLAQFGVAGIGGWTAGRLVANHGWTFLPATLCGIVVAILVGIVFGLPALRARGVNLAVITFGLGFATWSLVFNNSDYTGRSKGTVLPPQTLFGLDIEPNSHPGTYAALCAVCFALCALLVANLRRGRSGRRLLAVRANERAAASLGINVVGAKLFAFAFAAAIAGLGGVLLTFDLTSVDFGAQFQPFSSVTVMTYAVIGGIGYLSGPLWGSLLAAGGITTYIVSQAFSNDVNKWIPLVGGVVLLIQLLAAPDGAAAAVDDRARRLVSRLRAARGPRRSGTERILVADRADRVEPLTLEVSGVSVAFGGLKALSDVTLHVGPGEVVGLLGPNGAGKTTLVDVVTGYTRPTGGSVRLLNHSEATDVTSRKPHQRSRAGLSRSFQALELFNDLTVRENLLAACERRNPLSYLIDLVWPGQPTLTPIARAAVIEMDLHDVLDQSIGDLSFGQRRLVAIARSVAAHGSLLMLDEPGAGLDENETAELGHLVRRLADEWGIGILLIEHDVPMVLRVADRVVVLDSGKVIATGTPDEIRRNAQVIEAYLGDAVGESPYGEADAIAVD